MIKVYCDLCGAEVADRRQATVSVIFTAPNGNTTDHLYYTVCVQHTRILKMGIKALFPERAKEGEKAP